jgi:hypothetical protein
MDTVSTYFLCVLPLVRSFRRGGCKDGLAASATSYLVALFTFVYLILFTLTPHTLNVSYYYPIERDLVQLVETKDS